MAKRTVMGVNAPPVRLTLAGRALVVLLAAAVIVPLGLMLDAALRALGLI